MDWYTFLPGLLNMSLTACVVILAVLVMRLLLRRMPKVISYALWAVVLFRLLCPVSIGSGISLLGVLDMPAAEAPGRASVMEYIPENIVHAAYPRVELPVPGVSEAVNETLPQGEEQVTADPLEAPVSLATVVWALGAAGMLLYGVLSYFRLRRRLVGAVPLRDNIYLADHVESPFVLGVLRPKIYLPSALEAEERGYIILHEQHHIRRLDHMVRVLAFAALCLHWFNPLVWLAFVLSGRDMEMSCDEAVIRKLGPDIRGAYSASLLRLATGRRILAGMPLAFGEGETGGRIRNLAKWKKPALWAVLAAVVICVGVGVCLLTNPAGPRFDFAQNPIASASVMDLRGDVDGEDWPQIRQLTRNQLQELESRLRDLSGMRRDEDLAGFTPLYSLTVRLQDGSAWSFAGCSTAADLVYTQYEGKTYRITDEAFCAYLSRVCAGEDVASAGESVPMRWLDYLNGPDTLPWDGRQEIDLPEFPGVTFRWSAEKVEAVTAEAVTTLYTGMPVWSVYFCDLTGDGAPELCSTAFEGSGLIDSRILVYDYVQGTLYTLEDRGVSDYLFVLSDGVPMAIRHAPGKPDQILATGALVIRDGALVLDSDRTAGYLLSEGQTVPILPAYYPQGFDNDYDQLPELTLPGETGMLCFLLPDGVESLGVEEHYYAYPQAGEGEIQKEVYILEPDEDGLCRLDVGRRGTFREENAVYYIRESQGVSVFRLRFPQTDAAVMTVIFPAYQGGGESYPEADAQAVYGFTPFQVTLELPAGWTAVIPPEEEQVMEAGNLAYGCMLKTPVYLLDENGAYAGFMGWDSFDPDNGGDAETIYYNLTRGVHYFWHDFTPVTEGENAAVSTATVYTQWPQADTPATWEQLELPGICACSGELGAYIAIQLEPEAATEAEILAMAESITLSR